MTEEEPTPMTKGAFRNELRGLIDQFLQSGGEVEDIEEILDYHREGAQYYRDELERRMAAQRQAQAEQSDFDPGEIEEDSVEPVDE
jgi:hypothetical protein